MSEKGYDVRLLAGGFHRHGSVTFVGDYDLSVVGGVPERCTVLDDSEKEIEIGGGVGSGSTTENDLKAGRAATSVPGSDAGRMSRSTVSEGQKLSIEPYFHHLMPRSWDAV